MIPKKFFNKIIWWSFFISIFSISCDPAPWFVYISNHTNKDIEVTIEHSSSNNDYMSRPKTSWSKAVKARASKDKGKTNALWFDRAERIISEVVNTSQVLANIEYM